MASAAQIRANRANATLSTGPADTSRTRLNGLAHGLTSKQTVIRGESQKEYDTFRADLLKNLTPKSPVECVLAERVIAAAWRLKRFVRIETSFFNDRIDAFLEDNPDRNSDSALASLFTDPAQMSRMRLFLRYQTAVQREYDTAMRELKLAKRAQMEYERFVAAMAIPEIVDSKQETPVGFVSYSSVEIPAAEQRDVRNAART